VTLPSDLRGVTIVPFKGDGIAAAAVPIRRAVQRHRELPPVPWGARIVDCGATGRRAYPTISSAVQAAAPHDVILVRPGVYAEEVVIDKPLEIIGVGVMDEQSTVLVGSTTSIPITYRAVGGIGRISTLTVEGGGGANSAVVDVEMGRLVIDGCHVTSTGPVEASVRVRKHGYARLVGNRIAEGSGIGILVCEQGNADVSNNVITRHEHSGVEVRDGTRPRIAHNGICEGDSGGVLIRGRGSQPRVEQNDIFENRLAGIAITEEARPIVKGNRIHDGHGVGLWIGHGGGGTISENDVYANKQTAVEIAQDGSPLLVGNRIHHGAAGGVTIAAGGRGRIEHNEIRGNRKAGVALMRHSEPETFSGNRIVDNLAEGVYHEIDVDSDDNFLDRNAAGDWRKP